MFVFDILYEQCLVKKGVIMIEDMRQQLEGDQKHPTEEDGIKMLKAKFGQDCETEVVDYRPAQGYGTITASKNGEVVGKVVLGTDPLSNSNSRWAENSGKTRWFLRDLQTDTV